MEFKHINTAPDNSYFTVLLSNGEKVRAKKYDGKVLVQGTGGAYWRPFVDHPTHWVSDQIVKSIN